MPRTVADFLNIDQTTTCQNKSPALFRTGLLFYTNEVKLLTLLSCLADFT